MIIGSQVCDDPSSTLYVRCILRSYKEPRSLDTCEKLFASLLESWFSMWNTFITYLLWWMFAQQNLHLGCISGEVAVCNKNDADIFVVNGGKCDQLKLINFSWIFTSATCHVVLHKSCEMPTYLSVFIWKFTQFTCQFSFVTLKQLETPRGVYKYWLVLWLLMTWC